jgi:hypothetical protein
MLELVVESEAAKRPYRPIFTRFLYEKIEVTYSLTFAILANQCDEALFWASELYFSGWEHHLLIWLEWIRVEFFRENLGDCWWNGDWVDIGECVRSLCHAAAAAEAAEQANERIFRICRGEIAGTHVSIPPSWPKMSMTDTLKRVVCPPRKYLDLVSKYPIRKEQCRQMGQCTRNYHVVFEPDDYFIHWLYYASFSRVWRTRIELYGGMVNHETRTVDFPNDDSLEKFYDSYGYEPDEQCVRIHEWHSISMHDRLGIS